MKTGKSKPSCEEVMWTKLSINWMQWTNKENKFKTFSSLLILDGYLVHFINAGLVSSHTLSVDVDSDGLLVRIVPGHAQSLPGVLRPVTDGELGQSVQSSPELTCRICSWAGGADGSHSRQPLLEAPLWIYTLQEGIKYSLTKPSKRQRLLGFYDGIDVQIFGLFLQK